MGELVTVLCGEEEGKDEYTCERSEHLSTVEIESISNNKELCTEFQNYLHLS